MLPLAVLVYLLFAGFTPLFAGTVGLALTVVLILGERRSRRWIGRFSRSAIGLLGRARPGRRDPSCAAASTLVLVAAWSPCIVAASSVVRGGRETLASSAATRSPTARGRRSPVGIACAIVGIVIGTMTLTGVGDDLRQLHRRRSGASSLFLSLVLTMIACLVLGMGIPTIPNYIITVVARRARRCSSSACR